MERAQPKIEKGPVSLAEAYEMCGPDRIIGPREIERAWGYDEGTLVYPNFPYPRETVRRVLARNGMFRLGAEQDGSGQKITTELMEERLIKRASLKGDNRRNTSGGHWKTDVLFTHEAPSAGWSATGRRVLPATLGRNIIEQTRVLRDFGLENSVLTAKECEEAPDSLLADLARKLHDPREHEALLNTLLALSVTKKMRRRVVDEYFDFATCLLANNKNILHPIEISITRTPYVRGNKIYLMSVGSWGTSPLSIWKLLDPVELSSIQLYHSIGCKPLLA